MYKIHERCRACGWGPIESPGGTKVGDNGERLIKVFDLHLQPLANDFKQAGDEREGHAPLEVLCCPRCLLAQLSVSVRPDLLYGNYCYITSRSETMLRHFDSILGDMIAQGPVKSILEIGSNDGYFLNWAFKHGVDKILGIEPAKNLAAIADEMNSVPTVCLPFSANTPIPWSFAPDVILARHVFCHISNWQGFVKGLERLSGPETLICIEVPSLVDLLHGVEFDTIYHEHLSYFTLKSMFHLLKDSQLHVHSIKKYPVHGGAVMVMLRHNQSPHPGDESVVQWLAEEEKRITFDAWTEFNVQAQNRITQLTEHVLELRRSGKRVCGHGASAKSTVWLNACGLRRKDIDFVMDDTPQKLWSTVPGTDIPVLPEHNNFAQLIDYTVLFAWNYAKEIIEREQTYLKDGGTYLVPVPEGLWYVSQSESKIISVDS